MLFGKEKTKEELEKIKKEAEVELLKRQNEEKKIADETKKKEKDAKRYAESQQHKLEIYGWNDTVKPTKENEKKRLVKMMLWVARSFTRFGELAEFGGMTSTGTAYAPKSVSIDELLKRFGFDNTE